MGERRGRGILLTAIVMAREANGEDARRNKVAERTLMQDLPPVLARGLQRRAATV